MKTLKRRRVALQNIQINDFITILQHDKLNKVYFVEYGKVLDKLSTTLIVRLNGHKVTSIDTTDVQVVSRESGDDEGIGFNHFK